MVRCGRRYHRLAIDFLKEVGSPKKQVLCVLWEREGDYAVFGGEGMEEQCSGGAGSDDEEQQCEMVPAGADAKAFRDKARAALEKHEAEVLVLTTDSNSVEEGEIAYWMRSLPMVRYAQPSAECFPKCTALEHASVEAGPQSIAVGQILCARADVFYATTDSRAAESIMEERMFGKKSKKSTFNMLR